MSEITHESEIKKISKTIREKDIKIEINGEFEEIRNDYILRRVDIDIIYYPTRYGNNVTTHITITYDDVMRMKISRARDSWFGTGLDFVNEITVSTTEEYESEILDASTYENINSLDDVRNLINKIVEYFADFIEYYVKEHIVF